MTDSLNDLAKAKQAIIDAFRGLTPAQQRALTAELIRIHGSPETRFKYAEETEPQQ